MTFRTWPSDFPILLNLATIPLQVFPTPSADDLSPFSADEIFLLLKFSQIAQQILKITCSIEDVQKSCGENKLKLLSDFFSEIHLYFQGRSEMLSFKVNQLKEEQKVKDHVCYF